MRLVRADALDAMVDRANARGKPEPHGRVHANCWIENYGAGNNAWVPQQFLHPSTLIGDAGNRAEVPTRERRWHTDLPHCRSIHLGRPNGSIGSLDRTQQIDRIWGTNIVGKAHLDGLGAVSNRTATDRYDEIGPYGTCGFAGEDYRRSRRMRRHDVEGANAAVTQRATHLLDYVGFRVERVADHQKNACGAETLGLRSDGLAGPGAKNDFVHLTEDDAT